MGLGGFISGRWTGRFSGGRAPLRFNSLEFDTGLGKSQRAIVQDAMIELLSRLHRDNGGYLRAIEPTSTVIRGVDDDQGIGLVYDQLKGQAPAIVIATGDKEYKPAGDTDRWEASLTVHVYALVNSMRSRIARTAGDVVAAADPMADPGVFVILEHVEQLLIGTDPGGTKGVLKRVRPQAEHRIDGDLALELWEQRYTVWAGRTINSNRDIDLELKAFETYSRLATQLRSDPALVETNTVVRT